MNDVKCKYFGKCGGCSAQHIDYSLQLENKKKSAAQLLKVPIEQIEVFSANEYYYRNRMDFIFRKEGLGFREKGKWDKIIDIDNCPISDEKINILLSEVRNFFKNPDAHDLRTKKGVLKYCVIRTPKDDSSISFILNEDSRNTEESIEKIKEFSKITTAKNVIIGYVPSAVDESITQEYFIIKGTEFLKEDILDKIFTYHSQGFFQNNTRMAEEMVKYVGKLCEKKQGHLIDLYGGVGVFGISLSGYFETVQIVESWKMSIDTAKENITSCDAKNCKALSLDAKSIGKLDIKRPLHVITDPPRSGMHPLALERLIAVKPSTILYISCNPLQLSKELPRFQKAGYKITSSAIFDLFPQTNHFEMILELQL